jgi:hypothetical protein
MTRGMPGDRHLKVGSPAWPPSAEFKPPRLRGGIFKPADLE